MILPILIALHILSTCYMTGLIWFVQIVHYPLFAVVFSENFQNYEVQHQIKTTYVVLPPMLLELCTAVLLFLRSDVVFTTFSLKLFYFSLILLFVIWASTFLIQVPLHTSLQKGYELSLIQRLVSTNWIRTVSWTLRSIIVLYLFVELKKM